MTKEQWREEMLQDQYEAMNEERYYTRMNNDYEFCVSELVSYKDSEVIENVMDILRELKKYGHDVSFEELYDSL